MKKQLLAMALLMAVLTLAAGVSPAAAAKPDHRERFVEHISDSDPFFAEACGVETILIEGTAKVALNFYESGLVVAKENVKLTFTNPDTGDQVVLTVARTVRDRFSVVEENGLIIESGQLSFIGSAEKWRAVGGGGVLIRDAGRLLLDFTVVLDAETFELISFEENEVIKGPHPLWFDGPFGAVCPALGGEFVGFPDE